MLRMEVQQASHDPNLMRKTVGMLRLGGGRLRHAVVMLRLAVESQHNDPRRSQSQTDSQHLCLGRTRRTSGCCESAYRALGNRFRRALTSAALARVETSPSGDTPRAQASQNR
jgi:hypothetical protein